MSSIQTLDTFLQNLQARHPNEPQFHQAVAEVTGDLVPFVAANARYRDQMLLERLTEPDRTIMFRVTWQDDQNCIRMNRGYRVQHNNAIGPYKGGLRFRPDVNLGLFKSLAFEQTLKNSLTGLPLGGAKGGADFEPKGKSDSEVMRFCQAFITGLWRHLGPDLDIPAGDIGVGAREVGYMVGQMKRLSGRFDGSFTGKGLAYGGSLIRPEATGYGLVYMLREVLQQQLEHLEGKRVLISGAGNVAVHAAEKAVQLGAIVTTLSDSGGFIHDRKGFTAEKLACIKEIKFVERARIEQYCEYFEADFHPGQKPWGLATDIALPCATQHEVSPEAVKTLLAGGCRYVLEGANMPVTNEGVDLLLRAGVVFVPGKAANAGGVAVSGLEMSQNSQRLNWSLPELDQRLHGIMEDIHAKCVQHGTLDGRTNYLRGANIAGFIKVADAILAQGVV